MYQALPRDINRPPARDSLRSAAIRVIHNRGGTMRCATAARIPHPDIDFDVFAAVIIAALWVNCSEDLGMPHRLKRQAFLVLAFASCPRSWVLPRKPLLGSRPSSWFWCVVTFFASQQLSIGPSSSRPPRMPRSGCSLPSPPRSISPSRCAPDCSRQIQVDCTDGSTLICIEA